MSDDTKQGNSDQAPKKGKGGEKKRAGLAMWQRVLVLAAILLMVGGVAMGVFLGGADTTPTTNTTDPSGLVRGLAPGSGGQPGAAAPGEAGISWSPVVFRWGFSAFAGFAIGYALRSFLKLSLFAIGFFILMLLGLEYAQIIEVKWDTMADRYDEASSFIGAQTKSFVGFVTGKLPAAGLATAGLVAGLKR